MQDSVLVGKHRTKSPCFAASRKGVRSSAGFHYTRSELDQMEDPEEAHARRGAHWTFDAHAFLQAVEEIKTKGTLPRSQVTNAAVLSPMPACMLRFALP